MLIIYILSILIFLLLLAHLFVLPLSKKRPVFIKGLEGALFLTFLISGAVIYINPILIYLAIFIGVLFYLDNSWIVYGVSKGDVENALIRALQASRSLFTKVKGTYDIDNSMMVKIFSLGGKLCFIQYKSKYYSKKSTLTKEIFRKFVQNYIV